MDHATWVNLRNAIDNATFSSTADRELAETSVEAIHEYEFGCDPDHCEVCSGR